MICVSLFGLRHLMSPSLFPLGGFSVFCLFLCMCVCVWGLICFRKCVNWDGLIYMCISYSFCWGWPVFSLTDRLNSPIFKCPKVLKSLLQSALQWFIQLLSLMHSHRFVLSLSFHRWRATRSRMSFCFSSVLLWTFVVSQGLYERVLVPLSEATRRSRFIAPSMWIQ